MPLLLLFSKLKAITPFYHYCQKKVHLQSLGMCRYRYADYRYADYRQCCRLSVSALFFCRYRLSVSILIIKCNSAPFAKKMGIGVRGTANCTVVGGGGGVTQLEGRIHDACSTIFENMLMLNIFLNRNVKSKKKKFIISS
jgi:hypothetical protein